MTPSRHFTPGTRIHVRGEDFILTKTIPRQDQKHWILYAEGISELVRGVSFTFDTEIDQHIRIINPANTRLVADTGQGYRKTKLFIETQLRNSTAYQQQITIAHKGAFDLAQYQLEPTIKALQAPRPRILIADGVGLGKTIEVGIFLAEMMKRGKGKRIMVLALKSVLGQFQQEIWNRFAIPLVRLDSQGIAQIKTELPANRNPFDYYDKTIVSIDTLKNNARFRHYIERTRWDIIVIDECHTVANAQSQRGDLAQYLSTRCESLVLTSATPHNGKKESFANLIQMIEPTAIPKNGDYDKTMVEPYYVRRFKHDILDEQVKANFQDRKIIPIHAVFSQAEEGFLEKQQHLKFGAIAKVEQEKKQRKQSRDLLFSIGLFKAYMSSPKAALHTLEKRLNRVQEKSVKQEDAQLFQDSLVASNTAVLSSLIDAIKAIIQEKQDAKYEAFKKQLDDFKWKGRKNDRRIVVFTERIDTLHYLADRLTEDFELAEKSIARFHGVLSDVEQQALVEDFGKKDSDIRLFLTSDAGAQGVNLHFYCHTMFNYDIPWSLITLEQRNGRIDRYGQSNQPEIYYLIGKSEQEGLKTDLHILDKLIEKEEEVYRSLGDAGAVLNLYDAHQEEKKVEEAIIEQDEDLFDFSIFDEEEEDFLSGSATTQELNITEPIAPSLSLFEDDASYYQALIGQLKANGQLGNDQAVFIDEEYLEVLHTEELERVLYDLPPQAIPKLQQPFRLSLDKETVQKGIAEARKRKGEWAKFQPLYDLHPVIRYFMSKLEANVDKDTALVARLSKIKPNTLWYVLKGQVANNLGQAVISDFFGVAVNWEGAMIERPIPFKQLVSNLELDGELITQAVSEEELQKLEANLPSVIDWATQMYMGQMQQRKQLEMEKELAVYQEKLKNWQRATRTQLELTFKDAAPTGFIKRRIQDQERDIETILSTSSQYFKDLTSLGNDAHLKVVAVLVG